MTDEHQQPESYLAIVFAGINSVAFSLQVNNVSPLQMLAVAAYLETKAKSSLLLEEQRRAEQEAQKQIVKPSLVLPGDLQR